MGERVLLALRHDLPGASDEQLTDRARNGDQSAFGELYRRHRKAAESTAWCLLRSKSDADDVVSDAFAGVLSALRNGRGPRDNFRGYLLACVRNGCRSRRTPTVLVEESQLERWNPALEDPERFVEADTVARAFSSLAPRWQHTLWMTEVEQLPPTEVSERLELSPNAAAALTHRARQAFAEAYLAEHLVAATDKDCRKVAPLLAGYVRNQLRDLQQATVERHLVNCQYCVGAVTHLRDVNSSLRSLLPVAPPALGAVAAAAEAAVVSGTVATTIGGLSIGLPSTGLLLKGLVAALLIAPVLTTHSALSGRGRDEGAVSVAETEREADVATPAAAGASPQDAEDPDPTSPPATVAPAPTTVATTIADGAGGGERPTVTSPPTGSSPAVQAPATLPTVTVPGLLPTLPVGDLVDDAVRPIVGAVTEPVVQTLDQALAVMGLGSTGETITMLRSLVPLLDGPLLAPVVDDLLSLTGIGGSESPTSSTTSGFPSDDPADAAGTDDGPGLSITVPGGQPTGPAGAPAVTVPNVSIPAVSLPSVAIPAVSLPTVSLPPVTVPINLPPIDLPPVNVPILGLPPIDLPPISVPPIAIPDLLG